MSFSGQKAFSRNPRNANRKVSYDKLECFSQEGRDKVESDDDANEESDEDESCEDDTNTKNQKYDNSATEWEESEEASVLESGKQSTPSWSKYPQSYGLKETEYQFKATKNKSSRTKIQPHQVPHTESPSEKEMAIMKKTKMSDKSSYNINQRAKQRLQAIARQQISASVIESKDSNVESEDFDKKCKAKVHWKKKNCEAFGAQDADGHTVEQSTH